MSALRHSLLLAVLPLIPVVSPTALVVTAVFCTLLLWGMAHAAGRLFDRVDPGAGWARGVAVTSAAVGLGLVGAGGWAGVCLLGRLQGEQLLAAQAGGTLAAEVAAVLVLVGGDVRRMGWRLPSMRWVLIGVAGVPAVLALAAGWEALLAAAGWTAEPQDLVAFLGSSSAGVRWLTAVLIVVIAPLFEEHLFRGAWFSRLELSIGARPAVLVTGCAFGVVHLSTPWTVPLLVVAGLGLGVLRLRSGSLWPGFFAHALNNAFAVIAVLAEA
ncbi:MAG: CPBP family intramembrane metalloprotease [Myxococcales bacterium]|nr:CPBP family intramembrane metalloprotease [Myxococcales bacterium]